MIKPLPIDSMTQSDPDLVDRIFEYIFSDPDLAQAVERYSKQGDIDKVKLKESVRAEFKGEECYVAGRPATARQQMVVEVLALFNGRNATEVARRLGISRPTVYRYIKQARQQK